MLIFILGMLLTAPIFGQDRSPHLGTSRAEAEKGRDKPARLLTIYKKETSKVYYGNRCVEKLTADLGFQYDVFIKGQNGPSNGFLMFWHNLGNNTWLSIQNGPLKMFRVRQNIKECIDKTGDFYGRSNRFLEEEARQ
ncbi:MAG: hypothetical protein JJU23_13225 [Cyclobacteriaceae bacterium]|nr:hypothetical protein [Cyclobacteriaceae bacterium]